MRRKTPCTMYVPQQGAGRLLRLGRLCPLESSCTLLTADTLRRSGIACKAGWTPCCYSTYSRLCSRCSGVGPTSDRCWPATAPCCAPVSYHMISNLSLPPRTAPQGADLSIADPTLSHATNRARVRTLLALDPTSPASSSSCALVSRSLSPLCEPLSRKL